MKKYVAQAPQHVPNITLGAYVRRAFPLLPESAVKSAFQARDVKMDGVRCGKEQRVRPGAEISLFTPYAMEIPVVFENDEIIALDKPAGVSCDADSFGAMTAVDLLSLRAGQDYRPRLCHRLDNPTSGILLLAKNDTAEQALLSQFAQHKIEKTYYCLVKGSPTPFSAMRKAWLFKDAKQARVRVQPHEAAGAKEIITEYETIRQGEISLLKVKPHTGRTHQIRAHMAYLGHPLLGDDLYGDRAFNKIYGNGDLMLRSVQLVVGTDADLPESSGITVSVPVNLDYILERIKPKFK